MGVRELRAGRQGVGVGAGRDQALVDPGVGVRHGVLGDRAARAAGADRVPDVAVPLDDALLGHHQRLRLHGDVAVVAGVGQRRRDHGEALAERGDVARRHAGHRLERAGVVLQARAPRCVRRAAVAAVGDQDLVVPLPLGAPRPPGPAGAEERQDRVAVAVLVAVLATHDEGHLDAAVGGRRGDVRRRVLRVVGLQVGLGRIGRLVEVGVRRGLVAQRVACRALALVRTQLRAGEDGAAVGVVGDHRTAGVAGSRGPQDVAAQPEACHQAEEAAVAAHREPARHVPGRRW